MQARGNAVFLHGLQYKRREKRKLFNGGRDIFDLDSNVIFCPDISIEGIRGSFAPCPSAAALACFSLKTRLRSPVETDRAARSPAPAPPPVESAGPF
jgi:hypothetical protein